MESPFLGLLLPYRVKVKVKLKIKYQIYYEIRKKHHSFWSNICEINIVQSPIYVGSCIPYIPQWISFTGPLLNIIDLGRQWNNGTWLCWGSFSKWPPSIGWNVIIFCFGSDCRILIMCDISFCSDCRSMNSFALILFSHFQWRGTSKTNTASKNYNKNTVILDWL